MFEHKYFDIHECKDIPLNQDCYLMDERYMGEYEKCFLALFEDQKYEIVFHIIPIIVRHQSEDVMEISWYANLSNRFHELTIFLPKSDFVKCVECSKCGEKPILFVKGRFLQSIYSRYYSLFSLVDAIGVKQELKTGRLVRQALISLRHEIDKMAKEYPGVSFISLADSTILKSNWTFGSSYVGNAWTNNPESTYQPEIFINAVQKTRSIYQDTLGLDSYAIITQGSNEYFEDALLHISETGNHICLNSLGVPFAELLSIENSVRSSIKIGVHPPAQIYMDEEFYYSLCLDIDFKKCVSRNQYEAKMKNVKGVYYYAKIQDILSNIIN